MTLPELLGGGFGRRARLFEGHTRRQPPGHPEVVAHVLARRVELERNPEIRNRVQLIKSGRWRGDPDDGPRLSSQHHRGADDVLAAVEPALPEGLAEHDDRSRAWPIVVGTEHAPAHTPDTQQGEVAGRDLGGAKLFRSATAGVVHDVGQIGRRIDDGGGLRPPVTKLDRRSAGGREATRETGLERDERVRVWQRERPEDHGAHHRENRRVGADSERECRHGRQRERRRFPEHPKRMTNVREKVRHGLP